MKYLPINIRLSGIKVLVVGGGSVACRKGTTLINAGACVTFVSPQINSAIQALCQSGKARGLRQTYQVELLEDVRLVIAATDIEQVNRQVFEDAEKQNILVNVVDTPELCRFIFPSIINRSPMTIGISSGGATPVLTRMLREKFEWLIPAEMGTLVEQVESKRSWVNQNVQSPTMRRVLWEKLFEDLLDWKLSQNLAQTTRFSLKTQAEIDSMIESLANSLKVTAGFNENETIVDNCRGHCSKLRGTIYFCDLGRLQSEELTVAALRAMHKADRIIYDFSMSGELQSFLRRDAEKIELQESFVISNDDSVIASNERINEELANKDLADNELPDKIKLRRNILDNIVCEENILFLSQGNSFEKNFKIIKQIILRHVTQAEFSIKLIKAVH
ncbi:bifunctional precorrin-2 dehydrogenase/sirohydrochlorin ferrochelatase [Aliikangiella sp. G2MR2-5]|uniref:precorrin-2 dehydrogenase/sirohydrochlorin ferrochelatase family protein n=1 Tax=Aliikangiella sp. G2MR2-5 TaxID=2788943 RepID=UPI0018ABE1BF|nr:bifunctional precorrin-2 dehydrogenase/sirohydrochlorin ferrochelatase [Aliikangiella sp. G2MR2-5]